MHFKRTSANTLIMHQRAYPASREDVEDVRERYRLYLLTPPKKRHHRLNMEEVVEKSKGDSFSRADAQPAPSRGSLRL